MKTFTVFWTYIANFHVQIVEAKDADEARQRVCGMYDANPDFVKKGCVYVFEGVPAYARLRGMAPRVVDAEAVREAQR